MVEKGLSGAFSSLKPRIGEGIQETTIRPSRTNDDSDPLKEQRRFWNAMDFYDETVDEPRGWLIIYQRQVGGCY